MSQTCGVCWQDVDRTNIAPGIKPGDLVICKECDGITSDRDQARKHWAKHGMEHARLKKIEEAAKIAYAHLSWLDQCGVLTRKEEPMMDALKKALEP